jgi:hypothetical protein
MGAVIRFLQQILSFFFPFLHSKINYSSFKILFKNKKLADQVTRT